MAIFKYLPAGALFFLWIFSFGVKDSLAAVHPGPVITNSNEKAAAYFQLKKVDGTTEIVKVPARSRMMLGPEVEEFQYLYMEGQGSSQAMPDIPSMVLTNPHRDLPPDIEMPPPSTQAFDKDEKEKEQEKALMEVVPEMPAKIINQEDKTIVVRTILADQEQHILVLGGREAMSLPRKTQWVELRPTRILAAHKQSRAYVRIEKSDGRTIEITDMGKKIPLA